MSDFSTKYATRKEINREIIKLTVPAVFSNITVPLLGLSDTFLSGHLGSEVYLAAISVGTLMVNAVYWIFGFLRAGTSGLTADAYGKGDNSLQRRIFTISFLLALAIGIVMVILSMPLGVLMRLVIDAPPETASLAGGYFTVSIFSAPAILATMTVTGWMIGRQNTMYPMITAITVNVINIFLSWSFIYIFKLGFMGVAYGTLAANWCGLAIALWLASRMKCGGSLFAPVAQSWKELPLRRFFNVNFNLFLRSLCMMATLFGMTSYGSRLGIWNNSVSVLAINAILMQFFMFFSYFTDGFAYAAEAICGKWYGASNALMLKRTVWQLLLWNAGVAVFFTLAYLFFTPQITGFLTDNRGVLDGVSAMHWVTVVLPVLSVSAFMFDGVYIGITATGKMLKATAMAALAFFSIVWIFDCGDSELTNNILWGAFLLFLVIRGVALGGWMPEILKEMKPESCK